MDDLQKFFVRGSGRVWESPVETLLAGQIRALHPASHGNHNIKLRKGIQRFVVLPFFYHVYSILFLHQTDCIRIDPVPDICAC